MNAIKERLEYLRTELRAERISYSELLELESLIPHIDKNDIELLQAAGVDEEQNTFFVDIPSILNVNGIDESLINVESFATREEAIEFAQQHFGADENGMICLISEVK